MEGPLQKVLNPISKKYEMVPIGVLTITKPVPESSIPAISGGMLDSGLSEAVEKGVDIYIKEKQNESK